MRQPISARTHDPEPPVSWVFAAERNPVYSLNVPVPGRVQRIASDLAPSLVGFDTVRERHSIVVKRLGDGDYDRTEKRVRDVLRGSPAFEARVTGLDVFEEPTAGSAPVIYLAVESPGLRDLHRRLVEALGAVDGIEGPDYVPHVTLARGGDHEAAAEIADRTIEPVTWTVRELEFRDARFGERVGRVPLPA